MERGMLPPPPPPPPGIWWGNRYLPAERVRSRPGNSGRRRYNAYRAPLLPGALPLVLDAGDLPEAARLRFPLGALLLGVGASGGAGEQCLDLDHRGTVRGQQRRGEVRD